MSDEQRGPLGGVERASGNTSPEATAAAVTDKIAKRGLHAVQKNVEKLERLEVEYVELDSIRPNTYNPNRQDEETLDLLCKSITEDGFTQPVVVRRSTREIVDGGRAARRLGMTQLPIVLVDMTDEQMKVATLRHNRARGSEDIELGNEVLRDLQRLGAIEWAQDSLQLSDSELNELLDAVPAPEALADEDFSPAWVPTRDSKNEDEIAADEGASTTVSEERDEDTGGVEAVAMTSSAARASVERRHAMSSATTDTERQELARQAKRPFRLQFMFSGDEADAVKALLGDQPADALLNICQRLDAAEGGNPE